ETGKVQIGKDGTPVNSIIKTLDREDLPAIASGSSYKYTVTVSGALPRSTAAVSPGSELPDGLIIAYARVIPGNMVEVKFTNVSAGTIDPPSIEFNITLIQ
ncbi:MAG TPA: hypothetical protein VGD92_08670, partial [Sphingobacteriaceae bacterium]